MNSMAGSPSAARFDEAAIKRGAASVRHPLTRALLVLTFTTGLVDAVSYLALGPVRHIAMPDLTTTVLTMTLTGFAADSRLAGGSGSGSVRRLSAVLAMLVGAIAGALLLKASVFAPLGLAAVLAIATWLVYVPAAVRLGSNPK